MRIGAVQKTPDGRRDYDVNFQDWLQDGDSLVDVEAFKKVDDSLTIDSVGIEGAVAKIWLSGGEGGTSNEIEVRVTTNQGRIKVVCFRVRIINC